MTSTNEKTKSNIRTCQITRQKLDKRDLIRIDKNKEGFFALDIDSKLTGRGLYLQNNSDVIAKEIKFNIIKKKFNISEENYSKILEELTKI